MKLLRGSSRAVVLVLALLVGCSGDDAPDFALDGSLRVPDDEGIVTDVDLESVTLDDERTYDVERDLASFSAIDLSTVPLLFTEGQYVQVGVDGDTLVWIGAIARPLATDPPTVLYAGKIDAARRNTAEFANGTVLQLDASIDLTPRVGDEVRVTIDPDRKVITEVLG